MITPYQMEQIKCKFFQYDVGYKKFQGITTERLEEIKKDIERFEEITFDPKRSKYEGKLDRYYRILGHLTTRRDYTFDEKVAFVIMACDPNQVLYVDYKKFDIQSNASIEKIEDQEEKIAAKQYNDMLITELASGVRDKIGFYEPKLLRFEEGFYKKFTKELIPYSGKDYGDTLFKLPHDFTSMSATDYLFCKSQVSRYLSKVENVDIQTAIYHILYQPELLRVFTNEQRLLFFILAVDPELEFYQIYLDECIWDKIEARTREEKGYFNENLYIIERDYFRAFQPEDVKTKLW